MKKEFMELGKALEIVLAMAKSLYRSHGEFCEPAKCPADVTTAVDTVNATAASARRIACAAFSPVAITEPARQVCRARAEMAEMIHPQGDGAFPEQRAIEGVVVREEVGQRQRGAPPTARRSTRVISIPTVADVAKGVVGQGVATGKKVLLAV